MHLKSLNGCRLRIGEYPHFDYDARGGGGEALENATSDMNIIKLKFSSKTFSIPALTSNTTKFLKIPLPIGLEIKMLMEKLQGTLNKKTGEIILEFEAKFVFKVLSIVKFPALLVKTSLETGSVQTVLNQAKGLCLQKNGKARLVGIALIPKTGNKILDLFLGLPNEALAVLECELT